MLERLNQSFERSGHPQYIWIIGKCVGLFGKQVEELGPAAGDINATFANSLERVTLQVRQMEVSQGAREIPDGKLYPETTRRYDVFTFPFLSVMEDFCQFILQYVLRSPSTLRATAQLPNIIELALAATLLPAGHIVMTALELIEDLLQGALRNGDASPSGTTPADQPVLQAVAQQFGQRILTMTLQGIAQDYPEDSQEPVTAIVKSLCTLAPPETLRQWIAFAIDGVPGHVIPISSKQEMLQTFDRYVYCLYVHFALTHPLLFPGSSLREIRN